MVQDRRRRSRQRCVAPWRLEWPTRETTPPERVTRRFICLPPVGHRLGMCGGVGPFSCGPVEWWCGGRCVGCRRGIDGDGVLGDMDGDDGVGVAIPTSAEHQCDARKADVTTPITASTSCSSRYRRCRKSSSTLIPSRRSWSRNGSWQAARSQPDTSSAIGRSGWHS